jgi:AAA domain
MPKQTTNRAATGRGPCRSQAGRKAPATREASKISNPATRRPVLPAVSLGTSPAIVTATDLLSDRSIRPPAELVPGLMHLTGKIMLAAASKAGKTSISIDLALSVVSGTPFLQWDCYQGKVLYVGYELAPAFLRERVRVVQESRGITELTDLHIMNLRGSKDTFAEVKRKIIKAAQRERYALIIIDPIYKATGSKSDGPGLVVAQICSDLDDIIRASGAAVMFTHHFNKGNSSRVAAIDRMAGSGTWARDLDTLITVTEYRDMPEHYVVETTLRNFPAFPPFVIRRNGLVLEVRDDMALPAATTEADPNDRGLLAMLGTVPLTTVEWRTLATQQSVPPSTFYRIVNHLRQQGLAAQNASTRRWSRPAPPVLASPASPLVRPVEGDGERALAPDLNAGTPAAPVAPTTAPAAAPDLEFGKGENNGNSGNGGHPPSEPAPASTPPEVPPV